MHRTARSILVTLCALALIPSLAWGYDLKGKASEFTQALRSKLDETEDRLTQDSRAFFDELRRQWREQEQKIEEKAKSADDWRQGKRDAQKAKRELTKDFRQRARVQAEELELQISRFIQEREKEASELFSEMQNEVDGFKKSKGYAEARRDLSEAKRDISQILNKWRTRLRSLRNTSPKFE